MFGGQRGGGSKDDPYVKEKTSYLVLILVASIDYAQRQLPALIGEDLFDGTGTDSPSLSAVIGSKLAMYDKYAHEDIKDIAGDDLAELQFGGPLKDIAKGQLEKNMVKAVCVALSGRASSLRQDNTELVWSGITLNPPTSTEEELFLDGAPKEYKPPKPGQVAPLTNPPPDADQYRLFDIIASMTKDTAFKQYMEQQNRFMITNAWTKPDESGLKKAIPNDFFIDDSFYSKKGFITTTKVPKFFCPTSSVMDAQPTCSTLSNALQSGYEYGIQDVTVQSDNGNIVMRTRMETEDLDHPDTGRVAVSFYLRVGDRVLSNYASQRAIDSGWPNEQIALPPPHPPLINDITQAPQKVRGTGAAKAKSLREKILTSPLDAQTAFYFLTKFLDVVNIYPLRLNEVIIQDGNPPFQLNIKQRASAGAIYLMVQKLPDEFRLKIDSNYIISKGYNQEGGMYAHWFGQADTNGFIFTVGDLRRGIVEYGLRKFLGDYCQTLTSVASNGGYLNRFTNKTELPDGESILNPNDGRLGLHNDQPATAVALLLTMLGQGDVNPKTVNGSYLGALPKKGSKRPFVKYVLASRWAPTMGGKRSKNNKKTRRVQRKQKKPHTRNKNGKNKAHKRTRKPRRSLPKPRKTRRRRPSKTK